MQASTRDQQRSMCGALIATLLRHLETPARRSQPGPSAGKRRISSRHKCAITCMIVNDGSARSDGCGWARWRRAVQAADAPNAATRQVSPTMTLSTIPTHTHSARCWRSGRACRLPRAECCALACRESHEECRAQPAWARALDFSQKVKTARGFASTRRRPRRHAPSLQRLVTICRRDR